MKRMSPGTAARKQKPPTKPEKLMSGILTDLGLSWEREHWLVMGKRRRRYDLLVSVGPGLRLLIEVDGERWHRGPDDIRVYDNDAVKTEMAAARGLPLLRFWAKEIKEDPEFVRAQVENEVRRLRR